MSKFLTKLIELSEELVIVVSDSKQTKTVMSEVLKYLAERIEKSK